MTIDWLVNIVCVAIGVAGAVYWVRKIKAPRHSMAKALGLYLLIVIGGGIAACAGLFALFRNKGWFDPALGAGNSAIVPIAMVIIVLLLFATKRLISR